MLGVLKTTKHLRAVLGKQLQILSPVEEISKNPQKPSNDFKNQQKPTNYFHHKSFPLKVSLNCWQCHFVKHIATLENGESIENISQNPQKPRNLLKNQQKPTNYFQQILTGKSFPSKNSRNFCQGHFVKQFATLENAESVDDISKDTQKPRNHFRNRPKPINYFHQKYFPSKNSLNFYQCHFVKHFGALEIRESEVEEECFKPKEIDEDVKKNNENPMFEVILRCKLKSQLITSLENWHTDGNVITRNEAFLTFKELRRIKDYKSALMVSSWLQRKKAFDFGETDYANHLDLLFKVDGIFEAETFFNEIPDDMRGLAVYRALLINCATTGNVKQTENLFSKMKELNLEVKVFDYNLMILAYNHSEKWKIPEVLRVMDKCNVKPDLVTYKNLVHAIASEGGIDGIEEVLTRMESEGEKPDADLLCLIAKKCIELKSSEKAELIVRKVEEIFLHRRSYYIVRELVSLYALLDKEHEFERLWNEMKSRSDFDPRDFVLAISCWGKAGKVDKAEEIFESLLRSKYETSADHFNAILSVFVDHYMWLKANKLLKQMHCCGIIGNKTVTNRILRVPENLSNQESSEPLFHEDHGQRQIESESPKRLVLPKKSPDTEEIMIANSIINKMKPLAPELQKLCFQLKEFSEHGEVIKAERAFARMKSNAYPEKRLMYELLMKTYINANVCVYGFHARMLADHITPNRSIKALMKHPLIR